MRGVSGRIDLAESVTGPPGSAVVAAGSRATAAAAAEILATGGNAIDAAIAGMLAAAVAEPVLTSLGGGGFLVRTEGTSEPDYLDFFVNTPGLGVPPREAEMTSVRVIFGTADSPQAEQVFHAGWGSVAVPGCFAGYLTAHTMWGHLPLDAVVAPARRLAQQGLILDPIQQDFIRLVAGVLAVTPDSERLYARALQDGHFHNPGYAALLEAVGAGATMTSPIFAAPLLERMNTHGGLVTAEDLHHYTAARRQGLTMLREGAQVWTNPPPSFGGAIVLEALGQIPPSAQIDWGTVATSLRNATRRQRERDRANAGTQVSRGTTSISVIDSSGCLVTCTTSNGSASGTVVDGVQLNNMLGEEDLNPLGLHAQPSGRRMGSMMTPTVVRLADGSLTTFGSGGSERIRSAHVAVLLRLIDAQDTLADAVTGSRLHATETGVEVEPGIDPTVGESWADLGTIRAWPTRDLFFGGVHAVRLAADGRTEAIGDSRRGGVAALVT